MKAYALFLILLSGCATTEKLENHMQSRVGQNINDVIREIGPPSETYTLPNGDVMYSWINNFGTVSEVKDKPWSFTGEKQVVTTDHYCKGSYTVDQTGRIVAWRHEGNECRSR